MKEVLEHWNSYKEKGSGWKGQRVIDFGLRTLIEKEYRRGWTPQDIIDAISVFAMVFFEDRYYWTYKGWNLTTFLKRKDKDDSDLKRWYSFHPNNFVDEVWLSKEFQDGESEALTKNQVADKQKEHYRAEYGQWIEENTLDEIKKSVLWNLPVFRELIDEIKVTNGC